MPADFIIDEQNRAVFSFGTGVFSLADAVGHMDRLSSDPLFHPDFNQIIDFTALTAVDLTPDQIRELAKRNIFSPKSRRSYVVASDYQFGLSRMFATLRENEGEPGIITFRDLPSGIIWANVPADAARNALATLRQQLQSV